jgi:hypothetical protein
VPHQTPAQIAYEAYGAATGGLTHDGRPMPTWDQLGDRIQRAWAAAALALGLERTVPQPTYSEAWAELTGYVHEAIDDGGTIAPADLAAYMRQLRHNALAEVREWVTRTATGVAAKPTNQRPPLDTRAIQTRYDNNLANLTLPSACPAHPIADDVPAMLAEIARLRDRVNTLQVTCAVCGGPVGYIDCPTGGWWAHDRHPADGHDAEPVQRAQPTA